MDDDRDAMPSDREDSGMKPVDEKKKEVAPQPDDKKAEKDPSEQPS